MTAENRWRGVSGATGSVGFNEAAADDRGKPWSRRLSRFAFPWLQ